MWNWDKMSMQSTCPNTDPSSAVVIASTCSGILVKIARHTVQLTGNPQKLAKACMQPAVANRRPTLHQAASNAIAAPIISAMLLRLAPPQAQPPVVWHPYAVAADIRVCQR